MSRSWKGGSTTRWRNIRKAVLLANANTNRGQCALNVGKHCPRHGKPCLGICTGTANAVHHTKGKAAGDDPRDFADELVAKLRAEHGNRIRWEGANADIAYTIQHATEQRDPRPQQATAPDAPQGDPERL